MSALLWPGDERAAGLFGDDAVLAAMIRTERVWLDALVAAGIAPASAADRLDDLITYADLPSLTAAAEGGGNPVIPLVQLLRERVGTRSVDAASWLHRGLTSQDVLDTALMLCTKDVFVRVTDEVTRQVGALRTLADEHRDTPMAGRTLTQHAVPITFGAKVAGWLQGLLDAADDVDRIVDQLPAQFGGAAGTLSALSELAHHAGSAEPVSQDPARQVARRAEQVAAHAGVALGLTVRAPWHTSRAPVTRAGDALAACTAAWGRIANDVLILSRPEIGELTEPATDGRGGSSTMPQKVNPVLSVLIRRAALAAPAYTAQLQLAAAEAHDERPAGSWHVEWQALQLLSRHTVIAASQATELLAGLGVDTGRMRATLDAAGPGVLAEQRAMAELAGGTPSGEATGTSELLIEQALDRASAWLAARA